VSSALTHFHIGRGCTNLECPREGVVWVADGVLLCGECGLEWYLREGRVLRELRAAS
jgi:hypothetical protein